MELGKDMGEIILEPNLGSAIFAKMKKYYNRTLQHLVETEESETYQQVLTRIIRTSLNMRRRGIGRKDIVSICSHNHKDSCVPLAATLFLGAISANIDPMLTNVDAVNLLKQIRPKILFVSEESLPMIQKCLIEAEVATDLVVFGDTNKHSAFSEFLEPHPNEENFEPAAVDGSETAIILFSSGTTGLPKPVCVSHSCIIHHINNYDMFVLTSKEDRPVTLVYSTFYWISGIYFFLETVVSGGTRVVCSKFDPARSWRIIDRYKVTCTYFTPNLANDFIYSQPTGVDASSLQLIMITGFPVSKKLMDDLNLALPNTTILNVYGQTEVASIISKFDPRIEEEVKIQIKKPLSCGKIRSTFEWKVVDTETEKRLGPNQRGELRVKCKVINNGYYKMDASVLFDFEGYLKTGDIVYYDEDECFFVVDRIKEVFKYKGWQVLPAVLEGILLTHPAVKEASVIGIPHEVDGEYPMAIVTLYDEYKHTSPEELSVFVDERVSDFQKLRGGVKIVSGIQRTPTGKVRRKDLRKLMLEGKN